VERVENHPAKEEKGDVGLLAICWAKILGKKRGRGGTGESKEMIVMGNDGGSSVDRGGQIRRRVSANLLPIEGGRILAQERSGPGVMQVISFRMKANRGHSGRIPRRRGGGKRDRRRRAFRI